VTPFFRFRFTENCCNKELRENCVQEFKMVMMGTFLTFVARLDHGFNLDADGLFLCSRARSAMRLPNAAAIGRQVSKLTAMCASDSTARLRAGILRHQLSAWLIPDVPFGSV
jgi:hypothetical protein